MKAPLSERVSSESARQPPARGARRASWGPTVPLTTQAPGTSGETDHPPVLTGHFANNPECDGWDHKPPGRCKRSGLFATEAPLSDRVSSESGHAHAEEPETPRRTRRPPQNSGEGPYPRTSSCTLATISSAGTSRVSPPRMRSSTMPSAKERPRITMNGIPSSSASLNLTPGETLGRSS